MMKQLVIICAFFASSIFSSIAQPNGGFENWTPEASYENPDGWATLNFLSLTSPPNPLSVFKTIGTDRHSGNYGMKIKTIGVINNPNPSLIGDTAGGVFTGKITLSPISYVFGFPYAGRPAKLEFWAKSAPIGNDSGETAVVLVKNNGTIRDTIAAGRLVIQPTTEFTKFLIDLIYYSTSIPDTASIAFGASKYKSSGEIGSELYVDDIAFTGWVGIDEPNLYTNKVQLFPNPATGAININAKIDEADNIQIIDVLGKLMVNYKIQNYYANINTGLFAEGVYFYEIRDRKNRPLINGKFNVAK